MSARKSPVAESIPATIVATLIGSDSLIGGISLSEAYISTMGKPVDGVEQILALWWGVGTSIDEDTAMRSATGMAKSLNLDVDGSRYLASAMSEVAETDPYRGVIGARLLCAVANELPTGCDELKWSLLVNATAVYIAFIQQIGDGDVQYEAVAVARGLTQLATEGGQSGQAWLQLGLLHTQAIVSRITPQMIEAEMTNRMDRAVRHAVRRPQGTPHRALQSAPLETLRTGVAALDAALKFGAGDTIASAAMERIVAARFMQDLDDSQSPTNVDELAAIGRKGLSNATDDLFVTAAILNGLRGLGAPLPDEEARVAAVDPVDLATRTSLHSAAWVAIHTMHALIDHPDNAVRYAASAAPLAAPLAESDRSSLLRAIVDALSIPMGVVMRREPDYQRGEAWLLKFLAVHDLPSHQRACALIGVACDPDLGTADRHRLIDEAHEIDAEFGRTFEPALIYAAASLMVDAAFDAGKAGDYLTYIVDHAAAIPLWCAIGLLDSAREVLSKIEHVLAQITDDVVLDTVGALLPHVAVLESTPLTGNPQLLQRIWRRLFAIAVHRQSGLDFPLLLQVAKAARTSAVLRSGPVQLTLDPQSSLRSLLLEAERYRAALPGTPFEPTTVTELRLVVPYVDRVDDNPSGDPRVAAANIERTFDSRLQAGLLERSGPLRPRTSDEIRESLGRDGVLWSLYEGEDVAGQPCLYSLVMASNESDFIACRAIQGMHDQLSIADDDHELVCTNFEMSVAVARMELNGSDGTSGSTAAAEYLQVLADNTFPEVLKRLEYLYGRGFRRLIIDACGALHVFPFHLIGPTDSPLGCRWAITSIPCIEALFGGAPRDAQRVLPVEAFGMTFRDGGGHGLRPLWGVAAEVESVTKPFGATPRLDRACTEAAVLNGLATARFVHIASHGRQDVAAPSLQEIYLTARDGCDGRLRAYEIFSGGLAGLEMATLSACETALGRVDISDNPRGLAAALLLAGAQCVVGTLWRVGDAPARTFFSHLYERLAAGASRVDAFHTARLTARERHPRPCDWGAFVYLGAPG